MIMKVIPNLISSTKVNQTANTDVIGFVGVYNYKPNEDAALYLIYLAKKYNLNLVLIGKNPTKEMIKRSSGYYNIHISGEVSNIAIALRKVQIIVMPIFTGSGTRFKALEAMNLGIPIIATSKAVEGLGLIHQHDYLNAETEETFYLNIKTLINDKAAGGYIRRNAKGRFNRDFSFEAAEKYYA